ncbi:hypothetical protein A5906_09460 [Bradyrhizobium sacchari]|nr:hypothetical protein A5906_09460 [Bradyrhizobium sacchari]
MAQLICGEGWRLVAGIENFLKIWTIDSTAARRTKDGRQTVQGFNSELAKFWRGSEFLTP